MMKDFVKKVFKTIQHDGVAGLTRSSYSFILSSILGHNPDLKYNSYKTYYKNKLKYDYVANPYKTIKIEPREIEYRSSNSFSYSEGLGQIKGGDWDTRDRLEPIEELYIVKGLEQRFKQEREWENTAYVEYTQRNYFDKGETRWGCESIDEFLERRCTYVDCLYHTINNEGYRPESKKGSKENRKYAGKGKFNQRLEPTVLIGRDGEIIWAEGYHRYAIAKISNINIPVQVVCRHEEWQSIREKASKYALDDNPIGKKSHPDLQDII